MMSVSDIPRGISNRPQSLTAQGVEVRKEYSAGARADDLCRRHDRKVTSPGHRLGCGAVAG